MTDQSFITNDGVVRHRDIFSSLFLRCHGLNPVRTAVCWPCSPVALAGALEPHATGLIDPILVGPSKTLRRIAATESLDLDSYRIVEATSEEETACKSTDLCRTGQTQALMKGSLHTDVLMHSVLQREGGLRTSKRISHVFVMEAPLYDRPLFITDAAVNIYPSLLEKAGIIQNVIDLAHVLGVTTPKVAILSAVEIVCANITSTLDAAALCKMADRGQIRGAEVDGPLAFDTAVSMEAAKVKQLRSPVAGQADVLVVPDLESGNMLAKQLEYLGGARLAGIVLGAKVPIILTSRADSSEARMASCAIASLLIEANKRTCLPEPLRSQ